MAWEITLPLAGAGGEPVHFLRTVNSHGVAALPPVYPREDGLEITVTTARGATTMSLDEDRAARRVRVTGARRAPGGVAQEEIRRAVAHVLRLDEDLSDFYALVVDDPELSWAAAGAGRMMRSQTVFEDVVKTICTTNCAWSATVRMVGALVEHLGDRAPGAPQVGRRGRAFPSPAAMAEAGDDFYRDVVRAGYRGPYLRHLSSAVAAGDIDLEAWGRADEIDLPDEELERRLLALPGIGPYAAAHIMLMLGRYSRLILDSWTRPTFLRISGMKRAKDTTIARRFRRYGPYAGLAFWLYLTRSWVTDPLEADTPEGAKTPR